MVRMILVVLGITGVVCGMLGARGQKTTNRPRHLFWDMKYQGKYGAQGQSRFFGDGRAARMPVTGTVAYCGSDYFGDAGYLAADNPEFLKEDAFYYFGFKGDHEVVYSTPVPKKGADGKPELTKDGKPVMEEKKETKTEHLWAERIPERAVAEAGSWQKLLDRGRERYTINCSMCHGATGAGGVGDTAAGIVGVYKISVPPANYHTDDFRKMTDGEIFNTITVGKGSMSPYGHMVKPADRWAIVAYVRALQYSQVADPSLVPASKRDQLGVSK